MFQDASGPIADALYACAGLAKRLQRARMRLHAVGLSIGAAFLCWSAPAHTQPTLSSLPSPAQGVWAVQQAEFVQQVLARNVASAAAQMQADAASRLLEAERAIYDPVFVARWRRDLQERPRTYDEKSDGIVPNLGKDLANEQSSTVTLGVRAKLPSGATVELSHELRRRASNLLQSADDRESRGTLSLTLRQPLLRGAGRNVTEADMQVAEREQAIERQRFLKQLIDLTGQAAGTYWQIYRAQQTQRMRGHALELARELLEEVRRRAQGGFAPRADLLEAELAVGVRQTELARATQQVQEVQTRARNLLSVPLQTLPDMRLEVGESLQDVSGVGQELPAEPPATMSERWPEYRIAQLRLEQERIRLAYALDQERPDASLEFGATSNSLRNNQIGGALQDSIRWRHPSWYAGVALEMPLGNGAARGRRQAQTLRVESAQLQLQSEGVSLGNEWATRRSQLQAVLEERRQLRAEVQGREALLQAERETYEMGRGRLRSLIEAQDRLSESRLRLLDAQVRVELGTLALQAIGGDLLERFDVNFAP